MKFNILGYEFEIDQDYFFPGLISLAVIIAVFILLAYVFQSSDELEEEVGSRFDQFRESISGFYYSVVSRFNSLSLPVRILLAVLVVTALLAIILISIYHSAIQPGVKPTVQHSTEHHLSPLGNSIKNKMVLLGGISCIMIPVLIFFGWILVGLSDGSLNDLEDTHQNRWILQHLGGTGKQQQTLIMKTLGYIQKTLTPIKKYLDPKQVLTQRQLVTGLMACSTTLPPVTDTDTEHGFFNDYHTLGYLAAKRLELSEVDADEKPNTQELNEELKSKLGSDFDTVDKVSCNRNITDYLQAVGDICDVLKDNESKLTVLHSVQITERMAVIEKIEDLHRTFANIQQQQIRDTLKPQIRAEYDYIKNRLDELVHLTDWVRNNLSYHMDKLENQASCLSKKRASIAGPIGRLMESYCYRSDYVQDQKSREVKLTLEE